MQLAIFRATIYEPKNKNVLRSTTKKEQVEKPQFTLWSLAKKINLFLHLFSGIPAV